MRHIARSLRLSLRVSALFVVALLALPASAQQAEEITININATQTIDAVGNAHVRLVMSFNPPRGYDRVKRNYPNLYVLFRDMGPERSSIEIDRETLKISSDDGQRAITFTADVLGKAVSRSNRWQIELEPNEQISTQDANKVFTISQFSSQTGLKITGINTYLLPPAAQNVKFDKETRLLSYTLPMAKAPIAPAGPPEVDVAVRFKRRLMAAVYKVYGDMEAREGSYWVAKTTLKNSGKVPIYDLKIYYRLGEYTDLSVPESYSVVPPGGIVVDRYYPVIQSRVAELRTPTPMQLYVKYEYKDAAGKISSGELTKRLEMLGINQFEFSNLNDEDRSDNWFDYFNNAPLLSAFVTRMDDAVKQFAGYVSEAAGGADAASSKEGALRWLKAAYLMQLLNNVVYQTPSGFLTKDRSSGQDIKFPRDVFRDKSGTCVDLAITYAALAESVGLQANLMVVPGHTFAVIRLPGGELLPVENTGLGGGDQRMSFEQAVGVGMKNMRKFVEEGLFYFVNVEDQWTAGRVPNPELRPLGVDFLEKSGIKRLSGLDVPRGSRAEQQQQQQGKAFRVIHDHGLGNLVAFCLGTLYITEDTVVYRAERSTDGRMDSFQIKKTDIKEAKKNKLPLGQNMNYFEAFHVRLQNGVNYNFAHLDEQGRGLTVDPILMELVR
jgi:transglutaminase-like putative cysteine protease